MNVVIAGGSGFLGRALARGLIAGNHRVVVLTRNPEASAGRMPSSPVEFVGWDGKTTGPWAKYIDGSDAVVNLVGESFDARRWSESQKELLIRSRLDATRAVVDAIREAERKPAVLVNISGIGFYGDVPDGEVTEASPPGSDFVARLCVSWEDEAMRAKRFGVRVVLPRPGIVLARDAAALRKLLLPFWFFVGGVVGSGDQWFPWIHLDDLVGILLFALNERSLEGPVIAVAPGPVTMKQFCRTLGKAMRRPSWTKVPASVLRIALGEMATVVLTGQKGIPRKVMDAGYDFEYPLLQPALEAILS